MSLQISAAGMNAAWQRQEVTAREIAQFGTTDEMGTEVDLAAEQVNTIINTSAVRANASALRAQDEAIGTLLDVSR